jgi:heme/copper-type cytochrome/quinol oxidase subunit 4
MEEIKDIIPLLNYLLPGFLSAWIFYRLTSFPKPSSFERIIQALVFTAVIQVIVNLVRFILLQAGKYYPLFSWSQSADYTWSILLALVIGVLFVYYANNDKIHKYLRQKQVTRESSYPSEWFGAFLEPSYIIIHFNDERRLRGWPIEWPSESEKGHFVLIEAYWINEQNQYIDLVDVDKILINVKDVKMVEFLKP